MRLIDADNMLNMIDLLNDRVYSKREITAMINSRSTAYDIDKVVKELFNKAEFYQDENAKLMQVISLNDAIEIVKQEVKWE